MDSKNELKKIKKNKNLNSNKNSNTLNNSLISSNSKSKTYKEYDDNILKIKTDNNYVGYPNPLDNNLQSKIYAKREFYYYRIPERPNLKNYKEIAEYRNKICKPSGQLLEHQALLSNFINPDTPYRGLLIFHGTGTGKCIHGDSVINKIDMKIKDIWDNYRTQILNDDKGEWSIPKKDLYVLSYSDEKIKNRKINFLYREKVKTMVMKIVLENNFSIIKTYIHKLYNGREWTNILNIGDNIMYIDDNINIENFNDDKVEIKFNKIKYIEEIYYDDYVYDLQIEIDHNFIANNIFCHNTCAAIAIAEKFKQQVQRYGTHIYILVPGPLLRENLKDHFIKCTGDTYINSNENYIFLNDEEKIKVKKNAIQNAMQYYKIMSYRSFYRRVLGEKIIEKKKIEDNKIKVTYKKTEEGEFERDIGMDRLQNLNNSLLIIEEAHNLTGNAWGESLLKILKNSTNLKIILLTATPMKNLADDIIELINFIRPPDSPILRDLVFNSVKNHLMEIKPGGIEYLKKMTQGYVSHLRGGDPVTFAEKIEVGVKPKGLLFTKLSRCPMEEFQLKTYYEAKKLAEKEGDSLDRKSESVANFVFPGLDESRKKLVGLYGREGLNTLKNQLKNHHNKINELIGKDILKLKKTNEELININETTKNITGAILNKKYLKYFSTKFYQALKDIDENLFQNENNKESRTGFVYSNLVKIGIELFQEILLQNGYLMYDENPNNYQIKDTTICYNCGIEHSLHSKPKKNSQNSSNSSGIINHAFYPATFIVVTGQSNEEEAEIMPENNKKIINSVFNTMNNIDGKLIKLILGSKVMNEGISLQNVYTVQILDVYYNFGRVDQVVGRAIRWCSHYELMNEKDVYPKVKLFKYCVTVENSNELSTEEELYHKAELKYLLIKKVERALKEVAIDCPLNQQGNMFKEEIDYFKKCEPPTKKLLNIEIKPVKNNQVDNAICPSKCDFTDCFYMCADKLLNSEYYDPKREIYKKLSKDELDYSTFTINLARSEINYAKKKIKELFMIGYVYNLKTITEYVKNSFAEDKKELFDDFFVQKALDELIPITENDFNNFKDIIYDKTYKPGYLIYLDTYYIFQPFDEKENVPMYYRTSYNPEYKSNLSLFVYLMNENLNLDKGIISNLDVDINETKGYNFDEVMDYYDNRKEFKIVGIIDKENNSKKNKTKNEIDDVFKIREKRDKILEKKRGTGIPSLKGAVCATSKQKIYLEELSKDLKIKISDKNITREELCENIKNKLLELEKYSTGKNKMTYIIIPKDHPQFKFPLNLEDRINYIKTNVEKILIKNIKFKEKINEKNDNKFLDLSFKLDTKPNKEDILKLESLELKSLDKLNWNIIID